MNDLMIFYRALMNTIRHFAPQPRWKHLVSCIEVAAIPLVIACLLFIPIVISIHLDKWELSPCVVPLSLVCSILGTIFWIFFCRQYCIEKRRLRLEEYSDDR